MVRRRISEAQRWQIIDMRTTGMSFKAIERQMGYHYTVVSRLVRKHTQTNNVKDLPRSGRPFRQPPTSYKACVYGWQRLASSFKSSNRHTAYLGHVRPSFTGSGTACAKHSSVGSSIASGMAAAITTGHPTSNWRDETQGWGRHPNTWGLHPVLNF